MNIVQRLALNHPLAFLQMPAGWAVVKNNFIDADPNILDGIDNPLEQMMVRANFFDSDIFYAFSEYVTGDRSQIKATIDVWCRPSDRDVSLVSYELTFSLYKNKSKNSCFSTQQLAQDRHSAVRLINCWMCSFSLKFVHAFDGDLESCFSVDSSNG